MNTLHERRARSLVGIQKIHGNIHAEAHRTQNLEQDLHKATETLDNFKRANANGIDTNNNSLRNPYLYFGAILAILIFDIIFAGELAAYFAASVIGDNQVGLWIARLITASAIVLLEMYIAYLIFVFKARADETQLILSSTLNDDIHHWKVAVVAGVFFALAITCLNTSAMIVKRYATSGSMDVVFILYACGLALFTLLAHLFVIFSGSIAHNSKNELSERIRTRRLQGRVDQLTETHRTALERTGMLFSSYIQGINHHNSIFNDALKPGPFDLTTTGIIKEQYGNIVDPPSASKEEEDTSCNFNDENNGTFKEEEVTI